MTLVLTAAGRNWITITADRRIVSKQGSALRVQPDATKTILVDVERGRYVISFAGMVGVPGMHGPSGLNEGLIDIHLLESLSNRAEVLQRGDEFDILEVIKDAVNVFLERHKWVSPPENGLAVVFAGFTSKNAQLIATISNCLEADGSWSNQIRPAAEVQISFGPGSVRDRAIVLAYGQSGPLSKTIRSKDLRRALSRSTGSKVAETFAGLIHEVASHSMFAKYVSPDSIGAFIPSPLLQPKLTQLENGGETFSPMNNSMYFPGGSNHGKWHGCHAIVSLGGAVIAVAYPEVVEESYADQDAT